MMKAEKVLLCALIIVFIATFYFLFMLINNNNLASNLLPQSHGKSQEKIITKIIDGDTVIIEGGKSVRLLGIDCDEKGRKCYTPAKNRIDELTLGKTAALESEKEDEDMYGRKLRWIFIDGVNINKELVEEGYCVARFEQESVYKSQVQEAEQTAIKEKIGCKWS